MVGIIIHSNNASSVGVAINLTHKDNCVLSVLHRYDNTDAGKTDCSNEMQSLILLHTSGGILTALDADNKIRHESSHPHAVQIYHKLALSMHCSIVPLLQMENE